MGGGPYRERIRFGSSPACPGDARDSARASLPAEATVAAGRGEWRKRLERKSQKGGWSAVQKIVGLIFLLGGFATAAEAANLPILDTLGDASPTTKFSLFGSWGTAIYSRSYVGVQFTLTQPTVLTEVGGFVNNCHTIVAGTPQCPETRPFTVQIHPAAGNGEPDPSTVLAAFPLSHDNDPLAVSYESAMTHLKLEPGSYFVMFVPHDEDGGILLRSASTPFNYSAEAVTVSTWDPETGVSTLSQTPGAVRLLGIPLLTVAVDIKPGRSPNSINLKRAETIPVAILTTATFNASTADPTMVLFGATGVEASPIRSSLKDVDGDGDADLLFRFNTRDTGIACGDVSAVLTGETLDGQAFEGTDEITLVRCR